ncbi:PP2C family protein-serine/threonine phosphatase [Methylomarinum vadi]|uniref:PP2C family protein-serine/threonine phosphatase n=1 Tax=Methylomarinum vadi TaxID=438855 RepID=UPI0004DFB1DD|nr:protein phosphatase 2C domain-containing protein [Methylomarinum vadi]
MPWKFGQALNIGKRNEQQDRIGIFHNGNNKHLLVVADGMGGIPDGDKAAQIVVDTAEISFKQNKSNDPESLLEEICLQSHEEINRLKTNGDVTPGTTCVLLYIKGRQAYWAHVGDSRLYHYRQDRLINQTLDHSLLQIMIAQGLIEGNSKEANFIQNKLVKRLGGLKEPEPDLHACTLEKGDLFLLCSDGFWQSVETDSVPEILRQHPLDQDGPEWLVDIALRNGGQNCDNIGVTLAQWEQDKSILSQFWPF